ncbi:hypothetical protein [Demequina lignilytica]|uniref:Secreted protein n=1 Tax=Demequina lignilytica TaxID=3051663 RepID=A0AB35MI46_9MICO|nr:hypothetical protein [Demequina sp. SYSU T0a273]MDN4483492.1 hypothetical protein [Demequina sp. SYSU T0a273]
MGIRTVRIVATAAFAFAAMAAAPAAFAGEVNGKGDKTPVGEHRVPASICAFSGLNDVPDGSDHPDDPFAAGHVQSFGDIIQEIAGMSPGSIAMMKDMLQANKPGISCNKNAEHEEH